MNDSLLRKNNVKNEPVKTSLYTNYHPHFEIKEMDALFNDAILKQQADDNPLTFIRRKDTNATILRVNHLRASLEEAKKFREFMILNIHQGHNEFIIDLTKCEFMDSTFLGAIILVSKKLRAENGKIILVADPQKLKVLHTLNELNKVFQIYSTIDEAVKNSGS